MFIKYVVRFLHNFYTHGLKWLLLQFQVLDANKPGVDVDEDEAEEEEEEEVQGERIEERISTAAQMYSFIERGRAYMQRRNMHTTLIDDLEQQIMKHEVTFDNTLQIMKENVNRLFEIGHCMLLCL